MIAGLSRRESEISRTTSHTAAHCNENALDVLRSHHSEGMFTQNTVLLPASRSASYLRIHGIEDGEFHLL